VTRVALFAVLLVLVGVAAAGVGSLVGNGGAAATSEHSKTMGDRTEGILTSAAGYTLSTTAVPGGVRLRIVDGAGRAASAFDVDGGVRLHLIVVRRDLDASLYHHVHPVLQRDGSWLAPLQLAAPGVYRAFADFAVDGRKIVLGTDLVAAGLTTAPRPLRPSDVTTAGPYHVQLRHTALRAGQESSLRFEVDGATGFQTFVGARGHLVALHAGDLAYTHVHPTGGSGGEILFDADFVHAGTYRLFLQFKRGGHVYTAPFAVRVAP
jgi:hypothetical protein